jgi:hypothetical protein
MKLPDSDANSLIEPEFLDGPGLSTTNGHSHTSPTNGFTNGHSKQAAQQVAVPSTSKITLPGDMLHDHSSVSREEFVRLVIQSLRDVGYM